LAFIYIDHHKYQAFVSYMRSIYVHKDKSIFKLDQLPSERFADSLGLPGAPKIKFLNKDHTKKNVSRTVKAAQDAVLVNKDSDDETDSGNGSEEENGVNVDSDGASGSDGKAADEPESSQPVKSKKVGSPKAN
jgi:ATP-dependent RNA helicase DDX10/DBP4